MPCYRVGLWTTVVSGIRRGHRLWGQPWECSEEVVVVVLVVVVVVTLGRFVVSLSIYGRSHVSFRQDQLNFRKRKPGRGFSQRRVISTTMHDTSPNEQTCCPSNFRQVRGIDEHENRSRTNHILSYTPVMSSRTRKCRNASPIVHCSGISSQVSTSSTGLAVAAGFRVRFLRRWSCFPP